MKTTWNTYIENIVGEGYLENLFLDQCNVMNDFSWLPSSQSCVK